jgi:hypothetical protein
VILKPCLDCGLSKPLEDFPSAAKRSDGRGSYCRTCMNDRSKASYRKRQQAKGAAVKDRVPVPAGSARCPDCSQVKPLEDFPQSRNSRNGRGTYCKPCHNFRSRQTRDRLYGGGRHYHLVARYGISAAEADDLVDAQGGLCAICRSAPAVHVDHDHVFGTVRGVLCFNCNGGLGQFRDRTDVMRDAIRYLERTTWQRTLVSPGVYRLTSPRPGAAASATS